MKCHKRNLFALFVMARRRSGGSFLRKFVLILLVVWFVGVIVVATTFFSRSSFDQASEQHEVLIRENRGAEGVHHTVFQPGFHRLHGGPWHPGADEDKDRNLQSQFKRDQLFLNGLLNGSKNGIDHLPITALLSAHDLEKYDPQTRSLIQAGLIIPKWNISEEKPEHPGAPG